MNYEKTVEAATKVNLVAQLQMRYGISASDARTFVQMLDVELAQGVLIPPKKPTRLELKGAIPQ